MENSVIKSGALVTLADLHASSPFFEQGASLRVTGRSDGNLVPCILYSSVYLVDYSFWPSTRLQGYTTETAVAVISEENSTLKVDTQHLRDLNFRIGSIYQFIGELLFQPGNEAILQARVGRNVDGIDLNLYHQSLQLLRQFQADHLKNSSI